MKFWIKNSSKDMRYIILGSFQISISKLKDSNLLAKIQISIYPGLSRDLRFCGQQSPGIERSRGWSVALRECERLPSQSLNSMHLLQCSLAIITDHFAVMVSLFRNQQLEYTITTTNFKPVSKIKKLEGNE